MLCDKSAVLAVKRGYGGLLSVQVVVAVAPGSEFTGLPSNGSPPGGRHPQPPSKSQYGGLASLQVALS